MNTNNRKISISTLTRLLMTQVTPKIKKNMYITAIHLSSLDENLLPLNQIMPVKGILHDEIKFHEILEEILRRIYEKPDKVTFRELRYVQEILEIVKVSLNSKKVLDQKALQQIDALTNQIQKVYQSSFDKTFEQSVRKIIKKHNNVNNSVSAEQQNNIMSQETRNKAKRMDAARVDNLAHASDIFDQKLNECLKVVDNMVAKTNVEILEYFPEFKIMIQKLKKNLQEIRFLLSRSTLNVSKINQQFVLLTDIMLQISTYKLHDKYNSAIVDPKENALSNSLDRQYSNITFDIFEINRKIKNENKILSKMERDLDKNKPRHNKAFTKQKAEINKLKTIKKNLESQKSNCADSLSEISSKRNALRTKASKLFIGLIKGTETLKSNLQDLIVSHNAVKSQKSRTLKLHDSNIIRAQQRRQEMFSAGNQDNQKISLKDELNFINNLNNIMQISQLVVEHLSRGKMMPKLIDEQMNVFIELLDRIGETAKHYKNSLVLEPILKTVQNFIAKVNELKEGLQQIKTAEGNSLKAYMNCNNIAQWLKNNPFTIVIANQMVLKYQAEEFMRDSYVRWHLRPTLLEKIDQQLIEFHNDNNFERLKLISNYIDESIRQIHLGKMDYRRMGALVKLKFEIDRVLAFMPEPVIQKMATINEKYEHKKIQEKLAYSNPPSYEHAYNLLFSNRNEMGDLSMAKAKVKSKKIDLSKHKDAEFTNSKDTNLKNSINEETKQDAAHIPPQEPPSAKF